MDLKKPFDSLPDVEIWKIYEGKESKIAIYKNAQHDKSSLQDKV